MTNRETLAALTKSGRLVMDNTERFEYLGYMICRDPLTGKQWITDLNCWVADVTSHIEAKNLIDRWNKKMFGA